MNNNESSHNPTEDIIDDTSISTNTDDKSTKQQSKCRAVTGGTATSGGQHAGITTASSTINATAQQPQQNGDHDVEEGLTSHVLPPGAYAVPGVDAVLGRSCALGIPLSSNLMERAQSDDLPEAILVEHAELVEAAQRVEATALVPITAPVEQSNMIVADGRLVRPWYKQGVFYVGLLFVTGAVITAVLVTASATTTDGASAGDLNSNTNFSASPTVSSGPSSAPSLAPTDYVELQRFTLRSVFELTSSHDNHNADNSSSWIIDDGWNVNAKANNNTNVCQWYGITCDTVRNQYVTRIDLPNNGLRGDMNAVSQLLRLIPTLEELSLRSNDLTGDMEVIGGDLLLLSLKFVDLRQNEIVGMVTEEFCNRKHASPFGVSLLYVDCTIECSCCDQTCECVDLVDVDWVDDFGRSCVWYEQNNECDTNTEVTSRSDNSSNSTAHYTSTTACCACGGGTENNPVPSLSPSASPTINYVNIQRKILLEMYTSMNGENWFDNENWMADDSISVCDWYGVVCGTGAGQIKGVATEEEEMVIELNLSLNNLNGTIPSSIGLLKTLEKLQLKENDLVGAIPTEIGLLQSLQTLIFDRNSLSGTIPSELGLLGDSLTGMDMSSNYLYGTIPTELCVLRSMGTMYLSTNRLNGTIPWSDMTPMTALYILSLGNNRFTGSIPTLIGLFPNILGIHVSYNQLSGTIPSEIGELSSLYVFLAHGNSLSGPLPTEIGLMNGLDTLSLHSNSLSGTVPSEMFLFCNQIFSFLRNLYLGFNNLSGSIPSEIGRCNKLQQLNMPYNDLTGTVPDELGAIQGLKTLYLEENDFTGTMPGSVCALTANGLLEGLIVDCDEVLCDCCSSCNVVYTTQLSDDN